MITIGIGWLSIIGLFIIISLIFWGISLFVQKRKPNLKRILTDFVFILYLVGLVLVTMFPLSFGPLFSGMNHPFEAYVQLVPFRSILEYLTDLNLHSCIQLFGNIFMLAPLAIYINAFYNWSFKKNLIFVCLFSFGIEFVQGTWDFFNHWPYKKVDIDDVFSNMTGYLLTLFFIPRIKKLYDKL